MGVDIGMDPRVAVGGGGGEDRRVNHRGLILRAFLNGGRGILCLQIWGGGGGFILVGKGVGILLNKKNRNILNKNTFDCAPSQIPTLSKKSNCI